jgi:hypothetical protein
VPRRAREEGDRKTEALATALNCSMVGFLLPASFLSQFLSEYFWAIVGLAGAFLASEAVRQRFPAQPARPADMAAASVG